MPIEVTCPHCGRQTSVSGTAIGRTGKCPQCGGAIAAASPQAESPSALERPPAHAPGDLEKLDLAEDEDPWTAEEATSGSTLRRMAGRLMSVFALVYLVQSLTSKDGLAGIKLTFYQLDDLQLDPVQMAKVTFFAGIGWYIKPVFGLLSDSVPLFGRRRLGYLVTFSVVAAIAWAAIAIGGQPSYVSLIALCTAAAVGSAFADVAADGLMVETGQRIGLTGRFQATAWVAAYLGVAIAGFVGGAAAARFSLPAIAASCAVITLFCVFVPMLLVPEPRTKANVAQLKTGLRGLWAGLRSWALWIAGIYLVLWYCSPVGGSVMTVQLTQKLGLDESALGNLGGISGLGMMAGCAVYWGVSRRFSLRALLAFCAALGALGTASLIAFDSPERVESLVGLVGVRGTGAVTTGVLMLLGISAVVAGFGLMPTFDLAARACPRFSEGTVFAALMAATNFSQNSSGVWGAKLAEGLSFSALVWISAGFTFLCVPLAFTLPRRLVRAASEGEPSQVADPAA